MAINPLKIFLLAAGGSAAAATIAYVSGALDPYLAPPAVVASQPAPSTAAPKADKAPDPAKPAAQGQAPATPPTTAEASVVVAPSFDVVRVEDNGALVVAGKAAGNAKVEIVTGSKVIGAAVAGADGDFAVVLDQPLKPGDYQIVLRATAPGNVVATSTETAVVSVPSEPGGQVLALVEEPGKPSELITMPKPAETPTKLPEPVQPANAPAATTEGQTAAQPAPAPAPAKSGAIASQLKVAVEAVEIEGKKIFIAGAADAGRKVRAYANEILIGETQTSPEGRFLIEAERELPVGDYIIRVDALEPDGVKVVARAAVPFHREPGEAVAAVAPAPADVAAKPEAPAANMPAAPAAQAQATSPEKPAEVASAAPSPDATAPELEPVNGAVIIRRGDSLWRISRRVYGHGVRYSNIYLANQDQISDPDRIWPGQVFRVPEKSHEGEAANMDAMGEQAMPAPKP
ncbi:LysM peptidoglycan-binding domain-containing protein [Aminobacter sp. AP02]|uniref:LysM peptidoglycan-binding domain-containing protein n=1 Tax=Aminobacter sp. AP02 TaxID=2135737 RepID=UPI000D6D193D|nr:LysM peptidoglycan-binding domain-containing protein [Aminobacter sp. AP02]PWK75619.1 nucleoid-associated protein YgaU [Aminobacter sp. AP02]